MKRIIPAIIFLILIITSYIGSYFYTNKVCKTVYDGIETCLTEYKENGTAKADSNWLKDYWTEKEKILSLFVNHEIIDKVEMTISEIKLHSAFENNIMFYNSCNDAKILLHQIIEDTKINSHSVF